MYSVRVCVCECVIDGAQYLHACTCEVVRVCASHVHVNVRIHNVNRAISSYNDLLYMVHTASFHALSAARCLVTCAPPLHE